MTLNKAQLSAASWLKERWPSVLAALGAVETCEVNAQLVSKERGEDFSYIEVKANIYLDNCLGFAFFPPLEHLRP